MQKRCPLLTHVDERCLHSGQHPRYSAKNDVPDGTAVSGSFDLEFCNDSVLDESDPGFLEIYIYDDEVACHALGRARSGAGDRTLPVRRSRPGGMMRLYAL